MLIPILLSSKGAARKDSSRKGTIKGDLYEKYCAFSFLKIVKTEKHNFGF